MHDLHWYQSFLPVIGRVVSAGDLASDERVERVRDYPGMFPQVDSRRDG